MDSKVRIRKNSKQCDHCGETIPQITKKCPYCRKIQYATLKKMFYKSFQKRRIIMKTIREGKYTLDDVGKMYGITRERVRQIYKAVTGKPYDVHRKYARKIKNQTRIARLATVKFFCSSCGEDVTFKTKSLHKYCRKCHDIWYKQNRDPSTTLICAGCKIPYHPLRNWKSMRCKKRFHSRECYLTHANLRGKRSPNKKHAVERVSGTLSF